MGDRRSKSSDRKVKGKSNRWPNDEETGFDMMDIGPKGGGETLEEIIETSTGERDRVLTKTPFFYDFRVLRHPKKRDGTTKSGLWIHMLIWFGIILYSALAVMEGLEVANVGWDTPLFYGIFHLVLAVYFGLLLLYAAGSFMMEPLLSDNLRPAIIVGHGLFINGVCAILFLIWLVTNTDFITDTNFDNDPEGTVDYKDIILVSFVLYFIWLTVILLTYMIRFAFAKFIEILSMTIRHLDKNATSDYLETILYKADRYLNSEKNGHMGFSRDSTSFSEGDLGMIEKTNNSRKSKVRSRKRRSRSRGTSRTR